MHQSKDQSYSRPIHVISCNRVIDRDLIFAEQESSRLLHSISNCVVGPVHRNKNETFQYQALCMQLFCLCSDARNPSDRNHTCDYLMGVASILHIGKYGFNLIGVVLDSNQCLNDSLSLTLAAAAPCLTRLLHSWNA